MISLKITGLGGKVLLSRKWDARLLLASIGRTHSIPKDSQLLHEGVVVTGKLWALETLDRQFYIRHPQYARIFVEFLPGPLAREVIVGWPFDSSAFMQKLDIDIGVRPISVERVGPRVTVSYPPPAETASYVFSGHREVVGPEDSVRDVASRLLRARGQHNYLPSLLTLSFWGCPLFPGDLFSTYCIPDGASIEVAEVNPKYMVIVDDTALAFAEGDTIGDLCPFLSTGRALLDGVGCRQQLTHFMRLELKRDREFVFSGLSDPVRLRLPPWASLFDTRQSLSGILEVPPDDISFYLNDAFLIDNSVLASSFDGELSISADIRFASILAFLCHRRRRSSPNLFPVPPTQYPPVLPQVGASERRHPHSRSRNF
jgi:hypothetical protein